jgi:hypothetical protein
VTEPITLACNPGRLLAHEFNAIVAAVEQTARDRSAAY